MVGREALVPGKAEHVIWRHDDGEPAMVFARGGKGTAFTSGLFLGLEYATRVHRDDFDMSTDFSEGIRQTITELAADQWVVDAGRPTVEGILVCNPKSGKRAVCLMNWTYRGRELVPFENLSVRVRTRDAVTRVRSSWSGEELVHRREGDILTITLPRLEEGDVVLLE